MKSKANISDILSTVLLLAVGIIGTGVSLLDLFIKDINSIPLPWLKAPTPIILLIVSLLSLAIGIERVTRFKNLQEQLDGVVKKIDELRTIASVSPRNVVMMVDSYVGTEFEFISMVRSATKSVLLVGPNLHFLVRNSKAVKSLLDEKLKDPNFKIRFLISDPDSKAICEIMERSAYTGAFLHELEDAIAEFGKWKVDFAKNPKRASSFRVRKADVVTISLLFIDGEDPNHAKLILTPIPWKVEGGQRPAFVLYRGQQKEAYERYWVAYDTMFESPAYSREM